MIWSVFSWWGLPCVPTFFFQAEDGIRDIGVTGVQTCALPIFGAQLGEVMRVAGGRRDGVERGPTRDPVIAVVEVSRSEERRVGKECRYGSALYHAKRKHGVVSTAQAERDLRGVVGERDSSSPT